jgi:hypothetical protein
LGHVIRISGFENTIITAKNEWKRGRGRSTESILDGMARWIIRKPNKLITDTRLRKKWRAMLASRLSAWH